MGGKRTFGAVAFGLMSPLRNPVQTSRFIYHFLRGRTALFEAQPAKAKAHFTRAVELGSNNRNPLHAEALLFLAGSQQQTGNLEEAAATAANGLACMRESDTYTPEDVGYMRAYMARLLNMPRHAALSDALIDPRVRPSLRRDFPVD